MKIAAFCLVILVLFNSCYTYQQINPVKDEFIVSEKYEIRIGNREKQRVYVKEVKETTLLVTHGKTDMVVQKAMITESRKMKPSTEKTVLAVVAGSLALLGAMVLIVEREGGFVDGDFLDSKNP
ncbi:hypothetical protein [Flagellimonas iocasae]|uniref:Uncharacterized protein n=1 Tax=Flagellimonas iocasae TaxID=2055905 RepID=A0ABW4Y2C6_9FLAO